MGFSNVCTLQYDEYILSEYQFSDRTAVKCTELKLHNSIKNRSTSNVEEAAIIVRRSRAPTSKSILAHYQSVSF